LWLRAVYSGGYCLFNELCRLYALDGGGVFNLIVQSLGTLDPD
jgi:hypothetical protein